MARFMAGAQGNRTMATRLGHAAIHAFARGWDSGAMIQGHKTVADEDQFSIYATSGSNGHGSSIEIATILNGRILLNPELVKANAEGRPIYVGRGNDD